MQEKSGGEASEPPDKKNGITIPPSDPPHLSVSFERSVREKTKENTPTSSLALYVDEKTTQKHNPQVPPSSLLREDVTEVQAPKTPCLREGDNPEKISFLPSKTAPAKIFQRKNPFFPPVLKKKVRKFRRKKVWLRLKRFLQKPPWSPILPLLLLLVPPPKTPPLSLTKVKNNFWLLPWRIHRTHSWDRARGGWKKIQSLLPERSRYRWYIPPCPRPTEELQKCFQFPPFPKKGSGYWSSLFTFISPHPGPVGAEKNKRILKRFPLVKT